MNEFITSRLSKGNMLFPTKVSISDKGVEIKKSGILSKKDESIPHSRLASIGTNLNMLQFSDIILTDNSGEKLKIHGFKQAQVKEMKELIYGYTHK